MAPAQVTFHFARLDPGAEGGDPGSRTGMEDRTRAYLAGLPLVARARAQVRPAVVVLAHTASTYASGFANQPPPVHRLPGLPAPPSAPPSAPLPPPLTPLA